ncbi:MAG: hypothetical protein IK123_12190, partial [Lachnospiraceae bacterium]|nr:hypothetical protein [Lachnospiraceae bacterium]
MKLYKKMISRLADPGRSYEERSYIMISILGVASLIISLIFDIIGKESRAEIITIIGAIIIIPIMTSLCVRYQKVQLGSTLSACGLVLIILPVTFFCGGGIKGGGVYWIIFSYMLIGMSLSGRIRVVMMTVLTSLAVFEYWTANKHPEWIFQHTVRMNIIDG